MLEQDALLLRDWDSYACFSRDTGPDAGAIIPTWAILGADEHTLVGLVRPLSKAGNSWLSWFGRERLAVYESDDQPLLCTLQRRRGLSAVWDLRDADGHLVGKIMRSRLQGPLGLNLIRADRPHGVATDFRDRLGRTLATLTRREHDKLLLFTGECQGDPFARMLIFGAALLAR